MGESTSLDGEDAVFLMVIKPKHEGNLECVAKGQNNSNIEPTVSYTHYLKVVGELLYYQVYFVYHMYMAPCNSNIMSMYVCKISTQWEKHF